VTADSPASKSGLRRGDVILSYDGKAISTLRDLTRAVADTTVDTRVSIQIVRDNAARTVNARIGALETEPKVAANAEKLEPTAEAATALARLGLSVAPLNAEVRARLGIDGKTRGVVVAEVDDGKGAAEKGLRPGDIITSVNQKAVDSPGDVAKEVEDASKNQRKAVLLLVERGGEQRFVAVELADA